MFIIMLVIMLLILLVIMLLILLVIMLLKKCGKKRFKKMWEKNVSINITEGILQERGYKKDITEVKIFVGRVLQDQKKAILQEQGLKLHIPKSIFSLLPFLLYCGAV